jgi:hypothetical protein
MNDESACARDFPRERFLRSNSRLAAIERYALAMRTALVVVVVLCGACKEETWSVAGADVPTTVVPKSVEQPAVFPSKLGEKLTLKESEQYDFEYKYDSSLGIRLQYWGASSTEDPTVANELQVLFKRDPLADLTKQWGPPKSNDTSRDATRTVDTAKSNACWENEAKNVRACLVDYGKPGMYYALKFRRLR